MALASPPLSDPKDLRHNKLRESDRAFHDWYRFVLSYPPHLVRSYFERFELADDAVVLDPFSGTGTTILEAKKNGLAAVGVEATPISFLASRLKSNWDVDATQLEAAAARVMDRLEPMTGERLLDLGEEQRSLILKNSIGELPLHKCLSLVTAIAQETSPPLRDLMRLALAHTAVHSASNLKFGPEVGISRRKKADAPVYKDWQAKLSQMAADLTSVESQRYPQTQVFQQDSRFVGEVLQPCSIDAVITSPPYPNEKDYTRTTRLESVLLGYLKTKADLRGLKLGLMRSNSRNVYSIDTDDQLILPGSTIDQVAREIEQKRLELGKTSGFERKYHRVTRLYFGGMQRHLQSLQPALRPGARLAYVVGDQASFLRVMIRTGELLAEIADGLGYEVENIDLFRTRVSTATGQQLREEVVRLRWKG